MRWAQLQVGSMTCGCRQEFKLKSWESLSGSVGPMVSGMVTLWLCNGCYVGRSHLSLNFPLWEPHILVSAPLLGLYLTPSWARRVCGSLAWLRAAASG